MTEKKYRTRRLKRRRIRKEKIVSLLLVLFLVMMVTVGKTLAYLLDKSQPIKNTFTKSSVTCQVTEDFTDKKTKKNVNVTNTGDTDAYIRVKLVTYRVNEDGNQIGGLAQIPMFTPGTNWIEYDGYYYYTLPVAPGASPANPLIGENGIILEGSYSDADGGRQAIDVIAEAIQSYPAKAAGEAWGVSITEGSVSIYQP
ncbi:MAG: hypothetical protein ACOX1L_05660 [Erysipelotrichaceae bacterium]|jgi:hypothetical protein